MLLSMNWIGDFVDLSGLDRTALIRRFTLSTAEVEEIIVKGEDTRGVIAARIASVAAHPTSEKLHLLKIDTGHGLVDCVCGAPNVREGMTVAFAPAGGSVCGHEIKDAIVAGYPSHGMCCSEAELGIGADNAGIFDIPDAIAPGTDLKSVYDIDDILFEVDNKSLTNRPDLWGHYGIAREFAAMTGRELSPVPMADTEAYRDLPAVDISIRDPEHAYRYVGVKVENIRRHESPVNMRIRLYYCGSRAINLLADLTNYVMLELGQPMHAFDLRRVDRVEVRCPTEASEFRTLDGQDRKIDENTLMITSGGEPVAIAGIMGGLASEIEEDTTSLLLESACFDGVCVRKTSARLGLRTDASMRYEKMLDPELCPVATGRFLSLLFDIDPGACVVSAVTDVYVYHYPSVTLTIDKAYVDRYTGIDISADRICKTLTGLGFGVERSGNSFTVTVPSFRATKDVTIRADLIEEITRIYGYDNFSLFTARGELRPVRRDRQAADDARAKDLLVSRFAMHEVHSYIWCDVPKYREIGITAEENVRVISPQTPDHAILRNSMAPTQLRFLSENRGKSERFGLFEIGRVIHGLRENGECDERKILGVAFYDRTNGEEAAFLHVRDMIASLAETLKHRPAVFRSVQPAHAWEHPANTFEIAIDDKICGRLSVPHPTVRNAIDKKAGIAFAEIDMGAFSAIDPSPIRYREASRFPGIDMDLSFDVALESLVYTEITVAAQKAAGELLDRVEMLDIYEKDGTASVTLRLFFLSPDRTLTKAEVQTAADAVVRALEPLGMHLRTLS